MALVVIAGAALASYWFSIFVDPFIGDWDGMDYTMLSLAGYPSSMALGRNLFIFGNHALFEMAHTAFPRCNPRMRICFSSTRLLRKRRLR